jgi:hypothetical protein
MVILNIYLVPKCREIKLKQDVIVAKYNLVPLLRQLQLKQYLCKLLKVGLQQGKAIDDFGKSYNGHGLYTKEESREKGNLSQ